MPPLRLDRKNQLKYIGWYAHKRWRGAPLNYAAGLLGRKRLRRHAYFPVSLETRARIQHRLMPCAVMPSNCRCADRRQRTSADHGGALGYAHAAAFVRTGGRARRSDGRSTVSLARPSA